MSQKSIDFDHIKCETECFSLWLGIEYLVCKATIIFALKLTNLCVCIIKNFEEANFNDFKQLVVNLKINPQKYNCPQKTCKSLNNTFPGSKWSAVLMRIEQSNVYDKLSVSKFCLFLTRRGAVTNL